MSQVRAFPWSSLRRTTRAGARTESVARRALHELFPSGELDAQLSATLRCPVNVLSDGPLSIDEAIGSSQGATIALRAGVTECLVSLEPALARETVLRSLGRANDVLVSPASVSTPRLAAGAAAVLFATGRRAQLSVPLHLAHAGQSVAPCEWVAWATASFGSDVALARADASDVVAIRLKVLVEDHAYFAHAFVRASAAPALATFDDAQLRALGDLPLSLSVVLGACAVSEDEYLQLSVGDAIAPLRAAPGGPNEVALCAPHSTRGRSATLLPDGTVVVREGMTTITVDEAENLGAAPVVIRVEVGAVELRAIEWANLAPGDVLGTARRLGEPVVLRVGATEVARGELVELDGELGVRILSKS